LNNCSILQPYLSVFYTCCHHCDGILKFEKLACLLQKVICCDFDSEELFDTSRTMPVIH